MPWASPLCTVETFHLPLTLASCIGPLSRNNAPMQQRTKLLVGSLASSLGVIVLFAGIAFTSALDLARHQIPSLLHEHNQHLIEALPERPSLEQILVMLPHHETRSDPPTNTPATIRRKNRRSTSTVNPCWRPAAASPPLVNLGHHPHTRHPLYPRQHPSQRPDRPA